MSKLIKLAKYQFITPYGKYTHTLSSKHERYHRNNSGSVLLHVCFSWKYELNVQHIVYCNYLTVDHIFYINMINYHNKDSLRFEIRHACELAVDTEEK